MSSPDCEHTYMSSSSVTVRQSHPSNSNSRAFLCALRCSSSLPAHKRVRKRLEYSLRMGMGTTLTSWRKVTLCCASLEAMEDAEEAYVASGEVPLLLLLEWPVREDSKLVAQLLELLPKPSISSYLSATYRHDAHFAFLQQHTLFGSFFAFIHTPATYVPSSNFQKMPAAFCIYIPHVRTHRPENESSSFVVFGFSLSRGGPALTPNNVRLFSEIAYSQYVRSYVACIFKMDQKSIVTTNLGSA
mmetsp:Transcript_16327/g.23974  ORF Transcript_16327/g.23974 Transcript_16327/m.23974 type:complete len:244 (+) Transcript_16327:653-1384(+)